MPIDFQDFVQITSGVGGVAQASNRDLMLRIITEDVAIQAAVVKEYNSLAEVAVDFPSPSPEYLQAAFSFGFVNKQSSSPNKISFAFWDSAGDSLTAMLTATTALNNNYGSFSILPGTALSPAQIAEVALWAHGMNVRFMYLQQVLAVDVGSVQPGVSGYSGCALTIYDSTKTTEFPWLVPGLIMAATDYSRVNAVQNYMFQQFAGLSAEVTDSATAAAFNADRINYYGNTQQAGDILEFYMRGYLQGLATAPTDMGVFANEVYLKDAIGVSIMNLLLAVSQVPANATGEAQVLAAVQGNIDNALDNAVISVGKTFDATQIAYITTVTNDPLAFLQIQNSGYWIGTDISSPQPGEYQVDYLLLYGKNDSIRKVEGTHTLN